MRITLLCLLSLMSLTLAAAELPNDLREGQGEARSNKDALEGKPAAPVTGSGWLNTTNAAIPDLKGKIVVLDFWATWCRPCIDSIPKNNALHKKYSDKGVVFIGICHPRGGELMAETAKKHQIAYPLCLDDEGKLAQVYLVDGYPDYCLIGRDGKLAIADCRNDSVEKAIDLLLAHPAP